MAFRTRPIVLIVEDDPVIAMTYEDAAIDAGASVGGPLPFLRIRGEMAERPSSRPGNH